MKGEEWKAVYVTHDGKLVHNLGTRIQLISKALERGYDKTSGKSGGEYLQTDYLKNEDEYLVSGAQLRCSMATSKKMTIEGRTYVPENLRRQLTLNAKKIEWKAEKARETPRLKIALYIKI